MNILIADDHQIVRRGIKQILLDEYQAARIDEVGDAESAIKKTIQNKFDIVICDLSMPGRSGLDVVHHVKQYSPKLPVLILSIHPEEQYAIRVLKAGAAGYLNKDVATEELIDAVKRILTGKKYVSSRIAEKMVTELDADTTKPIHELLSNREFEIFKLLAEGKTVSEIAELLTLRATSVNTYRKRLLMKMDKKSNAELTRYALDAKLI
jgi:two-component system invasion response regulator UvrY